MSLRRTSVLTLVAAAAAVLPSTAPSAHAAEYNLSTATNLFTPGYRGNANTTYFGWAAGTWDGNVDTPAPNVDTLNGVPSLPSPGGAPVGAGMTHNVVADIVSSSDNIHAGSASAFNLTLNIPTVGSPGTGFTTIIIQGQAVAGFPATGSGSSGAPVFGDIGGVLPSQISAYSASGKRQWWAKYELSGNSALYSVGISAPAGTSNPNPVSVSDFTVDTFWSASQVSTDTAVVPEPATLGLLGLGAIGMLGRRRRVR